MTNVEKLLSVARDEIGYLEKAYADKLDIKTANAGRANYTKYGAWYGLQPAEWCAMFVSWCFNKAGLSAIAPVYAGCSAGVSWFAQRGAFHLRKGYTPRPGDVIFFSSIQFPDGGAHTGIVERCDGASVTTIEGNTSDADGMIPNGGCVARKSYPLGHSLIYGYGTPLWPAEKEEPEMTKAEFKKMFAEMRKEWQDNDAAAYSKDAREWAVKNGIVTGGSTTAFNGMWEDLLTREQMVTMLFRFAIAMGMNDDCENCKL